MKTVFDKSTYRMLTKDNLVCRYQISDRFYVLNEVNSAHLYLFVGDEKALLFDTGYGFTDYRHLIQEVTDLPLIVVCSHGHDDHVLGCFQFPQAYIGKEDLKLCLSNDNTPQREKQILSRRNKTPNIDALVDREAYFATTLKNCEFLFAEDGDVFDLGGLRLIVYPIPGHTKGSIGLYCPELKAVFTGDTMEFEHKLVYGQKMTVSAPPYAFIRALSRLEKLDIETVWPAHGSVPAEKALITDTKAMLIDWAHNADPEKDVFYDTKPSPFSPPGTPHYAYHYKHLTLSYNVGHLEQIREYMAEHDGAVE